VEILPRTAREKPEKAQFWIQTLGLRTV